MPTGATVPRHLRGREVVVGAAVPFEELRRVDNDPADGDGVSVRVEVLQVVFHRLITRKMSAKICREQAPSV